MKRVRNQRVQQTSKPSGSSRRTRCGRDSGGAVPLSPCICRLSPPTTLYSQKSRQQLWPSCLSLSVYIMSRSSLYLHSKRTQYLAQPDADVGQLSDSRGRTYSTVNINSGIEREPETATWVYFRPDAFPFWTGGVQAKRKFTTN